MCSGSSSLLAEVKLASWNTHLCRVWPTSSDLRAGAAVEQPFKMKPGQRIAGSEPEQRREGRHAPEWPASTLANEVLCYPCPGDGFVVA